MFVFKSLHFLWNNFASNIFLFIKIYKLEKESENITFYTKEHIQNTTLSPHPQNCRHTGCLNNGPTASSPLLVVRQPLGAHHRQHHFGEFRHRKLQAIDHIRRRPHHVSHRQSYRHHHTALVPIQSPTDHAAHHHHHRQTAHPLTVR